MWSNVGESVIGPLKVQESIKMCRKSPVLLIVLPPTGTTDRWVFMCAVGGG